MTDAEGDQRTWLKKPSFSWMVEVIGVLSGIAFVGTGVLNAIYFEMYLSLDYFSIATPSDVIMASFKTMAIFTVIFVGLTAVIAVLILVVLVFASAVFIIAMIATKRISGGFRTLKTLRPSIGRKSVLAFVTIGGLISLPYSALVSSNYVGLNPSGRLAASLMSDLPGKCLGGDIAWIGERNAVVLCDHGIAVFPSDRVVVVENKLLATERAYPPGELSKNEG